jgi:hypothetical protein
MKIDVFEAEEGPRRLKNIFANLCSSVFMRCNYFNSARLRLIDDI